MFETLNKKMIYKRTGEKAQNLTNIFWEAKAFSLAETDFFNQLEESQKRHLLHSMSQEIIEESIFIERSAMDFAAQMSLDSESLEQQEAYALMNADEVEHYFILKKFMCRDLNSVESNRFMRLLMEVMATKSKPIMVFFGQVLLEGLSIHFYRNLIDTCANDELACAVKRIYMDEASHHSIGVATIKTDRTISFQEKNMLFDFVAAYIKLQHTLFPRIIEGIGSSLGGFSHGQQEKMFQQMRAPQKIQESLDRIKSLLKFDLSSGFIEKLEQQKLLLAPQNYTGVLQ